MNFLERIKEWLNHREFEYQEEHVKYLMRRMIYHKRMYIRIKAKLEKAELEKAYVKVSGQIRESD